MMFCKIHDVAEAARRREARNEVRERCHSELLIVLIDKAQDVPNSGCIEFEGEMLARAQTVSDGVQSKVLMCALENSSDL